MFVFHQYRSPQPSRQYDYHQPALGYVSSGRKVFHTSSGPVHVECGELFHVSRGSYAVENLVGSDGMFSQYLFFYEPRGLRNSFLSGTNLRRVDQLCSSCRSMSHISHYPGWSAIHRFFEGAAHASEVLSGSEVLSHMKLCELIHLLFEHPACCVCHPLSRAYMEL